MPLDARTRAVHRAWRALAEAAEDYADETFNQREGKSEPGGAALQRCAMHLMRAAMRYTAAVSQESIHQLFDGRRWK